jgi:hypothetical protein
MANQYIYQLTDSWTDAGTTYNAIKMDVTDGGSAAASNLFDLRVEDVPKFSVRKSGAVILAIGANAAAITATGYSLTGSNASSLVDLAGTWDTTGNPAAIKLNVTNAASGTTSMLLDLQTGGTSRFGVRFDGSLTGNSNVLENRNGTNAQTFRVYNTFTDASNYERGKLEWSSNVLRVGTEKAGTGTARALELQTDGTTRITLAASSSIVTFAGSLALGSNADISSASGRLTFGVGVTGLLGLNATTASVVTRSSGVFGFVSGTDVGNSDSIDLRLARDAANILAQRSGTAAQTFRVYKTFTDASNYERTEIAHATGTGTYAGEYCIVRAATAGTGADNLNLVLSPAGTGAIMAQLPDGGTNGGIARGTGAADFQVARTSASNVASGNYSFVAGYNCRAAGSQSIAIGQNSTASQNDAVVFGYNNTASGFSSFCVGFSSTSSGSRSMALGNEVQATADHSFASGSKAFANKYGQIARSNGNFAAIGDAQSSKMVLRNATTDATATELFLDGSSARATIPNNTCWHADIRIVARQATGTNHATYHRKCTIYKNTTAASTTLVGTVQTIGTDEESDANWAVAVTADTTNGSLKIEVTGVAATNIRWVAELSVVEVAYA